MTVYTAFGTIDIIKMILIISIHDYSSHVKITLIIIYHYSALYQKLYIQSKRAPEDGRICDPKHVGLIEKINRQKSCCILLVVYIVVLK